MFWWLTVGFLILLFLTACLAVLICFYKIFWVKRKAQPEEVVFPMDEKFAPHRARFEKWLAEMRNTPRKEFTIRSFDGLLLYGYYFEYEKGAPIELMIHGYRGDAERDLCCGVERCFALGHSAFIIDHRACGKSEGTVISFGINESRDVTAWIDCIIENIDQDAKIILTGISMGAATAMICAGKQLPENVVGVLADCGYTSAKEIIQKVMADMKLPPKLLYPFAKIAARVLGRFDLEEISPLEAMPNCRLPIIFFHGDSDGFIPWEMSERNFHACASEHKKLVITKGAAHVLCYVVDSENYLKELRAFFEPLTKR